MALTQSLTHYAEEMRWFAEANEMYLALAEKADSSHDWDVAAIAYHHQGRIAQERRDFPQAGDFYLRSIKIFADTNDPHSLKIVIRSYARLMHTTAGTEHSQLRQAWSACMPQELTKILEEMEVELNDANS